MRMTAAKHAEEPLRLDISGARVMRTSLRNTDLTEANLSRADCSFVDFRGANFKNARLTGTILRGADLRGARNLTREQLAEAILDDTTLLPEELRV